MTNAPGDGQWSNANDLAGGRCAPETNAHTSMRQENRAQRDQYNRAECNVDMPDVSVVLSTYNRGPLLVDAVRSLLALDPDSPSHDIIIVDNNSTDDTRERVHAMIGETDRIRYVFEPRQGVSYGRNAGTAASCSPIIAFVDDDVRVSPVWLTALTRAFREHPEIAYVGGRIAPLFPSPPPFWYTHDSHSSPLALVDYGFKGREITRTSFLCLVSANLAVRRSILREHGGFDPRYHHQPGSVSASEDHELQARLLRAGLRGWYEPDALMFAEVQKERLKLRYHLKWHFDHGQAMIRMSPPGTFFDTACDFVTLKPTAKTIKGVPLYLTRGLMRAFAQSWRRVMRGDGEGAVWSWGQVLESVGAIDYYARVRGRGLDAGNYDASAPRV